MRNKSYTAQVTLGSVYGLLTAIEFVEEFVVKCKCACGNFKILPAYRLLSGDARSCGCSKKRCAVGKMINGRVIVEAGTKTRLPKAKCLDCGKISRVAAWDKKKCRNCYPWDGRMTTGSVYGILCPLTHEIVYVGSTKGLAYNRVRGHFTDRNSKDNKSHPLYMWMRELARNGHMPGCVQLEMVDGGNLHERELFWIQKMIQEGCILLNVEHNRT